MIHDFYDVLYVYIIICYSNILGFLKGVVEKNKSFYNSIKLL